MDKKSISGVAALLAIIAFAAIYFYPWATREGSPTDATVATTDANQRTTNPTSSQASDLTATLTAYLSSEMKTLGEGGSSTNVDLTAYLGEISLDSNGIPNGEVPHWSDPVEITSSEYGIALNTPSSASEPVVILHATLLTNGRSHAFAYIGNFTERGVISRRELLNLDAGDQSLADWKASWKFERR
jgi:hypothetical protein